MLLLDSTETTPALPIQIPLEGRTTKIQHSRAQSQTMGESPCFMSLFPPDQPLPSQDPNIMESVRSVVVVRHGERLDYIMRDRGENWIPSSDRPWDPPLTDNGREQANALGAALPNMLEKLNLPSIAAVYSSPFYRCRQTASGLCSSQEELKVKVEVGLSESISQNWYRSWAISGTDGSWGYGKDDCPDPSLLDPDSLHPSSKEPVQPLLDWKQATSDSILEKKMDVGHVSKSAIDIPYSLHPPIFENYKTQGRRMHDTLNQLSEQHLDETILVVSHGTYHFFH